MWWLVSACTSSDDTAGPPSDDTRPPAETAETADTGTIPPPPPPVITTAELAPPGNGVQLARRIVVETDVATTLEVSFTDGTHTVAIDFPDVSTHHDHLLLGFRPGRSYTLDATVTAQGVSAAIALAVETQPLDPFMPVAEVLAHDPTRRAPGDTLLPIRCTMPEPCVPSEMVMVVDADGEIVYVKDVGPEIVQNATEFDGGLLVVSGSGDAVATHYAWDGTELGRWSIGGPGVEVDTSLAAALHHDVIPHPVDPERFLAIGRYPLLEPNYPLDYVDPSARGSQVIAADVLVEFDRLGVVHREVALAPLLSTTRIGYESLGTVPQGWMDWAHTNSLWLDGDDWVVSLRNQDAVVKLDPDTSQVSWIAGAPGNWPPELQPLLLTPEGDPFAWSYHQHAAMTAQDGDRTALYVFDNGNWQTVPYSGIAPLTPPAEGAPLPADLHSRVVRYDIDEAAMTIRQAWAFDASLVAGGSLFSSVIGDVDLLSTGNVLGAFGSLETLPGGQNTNEWAGYGDKSVRVIEFDPYSGMEEIWHLHLTSDRASGNLGGFTAYRAERIPAIGGRIVD